MFCFRFVYKLIFVDLNSKRYTLLFLSLFIFLNKGNVEVTKFSKILCLMLVHLCFEIFVWTDFCRFELRKCLHMKLVLKCALLIDIVNYLKCLPHHHHHHDDDHAHGQVRRKRTVHMCTHCILCTKLLKREEL